MIRILTIIGARPQIIKAAALSRAIRNKFSKKIEEKILHTGQHYDDNMSDIFFTELDIPQPDYNLHIGSGTHGGQTSKMIAGIEQILINEKFDAIVLYGDTNSTLAGAITASKLHIPIIHIEAGLRSYNKTMPEEINRIMCDHVSTLLFSPTQTGIKNLKNEGFSTQNTAPFSIDNPGIFCSGDIMYDNSIYFSEIASQKTNILTNYNIQPGKYILATIHRDNNTDDHNRLRNILEAFLEIAEKNNISVVFPLHPRTKKTLTEPTLNDLFNKIKNCNLIKIIPPASFLEMVVLEKNALLIMTDSGGVQKEAYYFKKPCVILRNETEWIEILENNAGVLADANKTAIINAFEKMKNCQSAFPPVFGNAHAAEFILTELLKQQPATNNNINKNQ